MVWKEREARAETRNEYRRQVLAELRRSENAAEIMGWPSGTKIRNEEESGFLHETRLEMRDRAGRLWGAGCCLKCRLVGGGMTTTGTEKGRVGSG